MDIKRELQVEIDKQGLCTCTAPRLHDLSKAALERNEEQEQAVKVCAGVGKLTRAFYAQQQRIALQYG
jgi:hypothetical protein